MIAEGGRDAFYEGDIARTIDAYFKRIGGWPSSADLAAHKSKWTQPYATAYRGVAVHAIGANTQGQATPQLLDLLEPFDLKGAGFQPPLSLHLHSTEERRVGQEWGSNVR